MSRPVQIIGTVFVLLCMGAYIYTQRGMFAQTLGHFDAHYFPALLAVPLLSIAANGWIGREILLPFNVRLTFVEWYGLTTLNAVGNYLPIPQAGAIARGVYLKRVYNLSYSHYMATVLVTYVLSLVVAGGMGLAALALALTLKMPAPWPLWFAFAVLTSTAILFTPAAKLFKRFKRLAVFEEGLNTLRRRYIFAIVALFQTSLILLTAAGLWLAMLSIHQDVGFVACVVFALAYQTSGILNITPGNAGVAEGAVGLAAHFLRVDVVPAVAASLIFRVIAILAITVLGPIFMMLLGKKRDAAIAVASPAAGDQP